jgi:hypothetical protein
MDVLSARAATIALLCVLLWGAPSVHAQTPLRVDYSRVEAQGSPYVFGGSQPRGITEAQWDSLAAQGFTFVRMQADVTELVPCASPEAYRRNDDGCAEPANWDWTDGVYGDNFARKAMRRGMRVAMVVKNGHWNRYPGAPVDEETVPRDLDVWGEVLRTIINHYDGGIQYVELFNEVDRAPQFRVTGSPHTRRSGYKAVARHALWAVRGSEHPDTRLGGPVAAGMGAEEAAWLLREADIRAHLGFLSFHAFDDLEYPRRVVDSLEAVMARYDVDLPILRSSYVPERKEAGSKEPGTTDPVAVAPHLIGALRDGLEAAGLWEIQNRSGDDDVRYWFDGDRVTPTADLWRLMSLRLDLGDGTSTVVHVEGVPYTSAFAALNPEAEPVGVVVAEEGGAAYEMALRGLPMEDGSVRIRLLGLDGPLSNSPVQTEVRDGAVDFRLPVPSRGVYAYEVKTGS